MIRIAAVGAAGRMGREVVRLAIETEDLELVAAFDLACEGSDAGQLAGVNAPSVKIGPFSPDALKSSGAEVLVDFSTGAAAAEHARTALSMGVSPVIGATGIPDSEVEGLRVIADQVRTGAIYAPNFSIGAVLMMHFAALAARHLDAAEIIELHHDGKKDAPSGTAKLTAQRIADVWSKSSKQPGQEHPARGATVYGIPVHSVRLPGLVAHQEVLFGAPGQTLTIRHDSTDRRSFMPGVLLAVRSVRRLDHMVIGLDRLLGLS